MVVVTWLLLAILAAGLVGVAPRLRGTFGLFVLAAITAIGAWLRFRHIPFHHAMYVDEPWYQEAARNFLHGRGLVICEADLTGEHCDPYIKSAGWPAILALAFKLGGSSDHTAFVASALFGVAAIPAVAFVSRAAGGRWASANLSATLMALLPVHIQWSTTAETNVAAVTLLLLGLGGTLSFAVRADWPSMLLAVGGLGAAATVRPELWIAFLPAAPLLWRRSLTTSVLIGGALLAALPGIAARGAFSVHTQGALFEWSSLGPNLRAWLTNPGELGPYSVALLVLGALGFVTALRMERRAALLLGGIALLIGGFVLVYYPPAGFYSRTMLGALAPIAVLAGLALPRGIAGAIGSAATIVVLGALVWTHREEWSRVSDTQLAETQLPGLATDYAWGKDAVVIAEQPTILSGMEGVRVVSAAKVGASANLADGSTYLACDMYCEPHYGGDNGESGCRKILRDYVVEPVRAMNGPHRNYGFYRIVRRSEVPIEHPICPVIDCPRKQ